jgi:16S rRNA (uracil1498-N3)-methyltransferase
MKTIPAVVLNMPVVENQKASRHYVSLSLAVGTSIVLPDEIAHHVIRVLRLRSDDTIALFNGNGDLYSGNLTIEGKDKASVHINRKETPATESQLHITLLQGLASNEKMAWAIEKATELGAVKIVPVACERSVSQISGEKAEKKLQHWLNIAKAAAAQCGRVIIPEISPAIRSNAVEPMKLIASEHDHAVVLDPKGLSSLSTWSKSIDARKIVVYVGPEGGLSSDEIVCANQAGFESLRMGPRILRTETAGPAVIAALQALKGDF